MAKLGEQLQQARPTRTERVGEQQRQEKFEKLQGIERQRIQTKVDTASETMQNISYEDYETEYNKLDPETKSYFQTPEKLKQTEGYQTYVKEKAEYDKQVAQYEAQQKEIAYANQQKAEWEQAEKIFFKATMGASGGRYDPRSSVGRKVDKLYKHRETAMQTIEEINIKALAKQGIKPIKKGAVVVAYKDEFGNISYDPKLEGLQVKRDPDEVYKEWQETQAPIERAPIVSEVKVSDVVDDRKWYEKSMEDLFIKKGREKAKAGVSFVGGKIKDVGSFVWDKGTDFYEKIPSSQSAIYDPKIKTMEEFDVKIAEQEKIQAERIGLEDIQEKYGAISQTAFETKYMKELIYGEKTFEQASAEFEQSGEALQISKDYQSEVNKALSDEGFTKEGWKVAGLETGKTAVSLIPTTAKGVALTFVGVKVGYGAYKRIPKIIKSFSFTGLGVYEGAKLVSPTTTPSQKAGAILTLGTFGLSGVYSGVKWARTPVPKPIKIPAPRISLKASEIIGKDYGTIVKFDAQKLSQQVSAGQRTIVKTKGSLFLEKYTGIKLKPIYEGVPVSQAKYSVEGLGGSFQFSTPSAYQKAYKKLIKYKYTPSQARATLRYSPPQVQELELQKGAVVIKGEKALARFDHLIKKPVIEVDDLLGIKTRGAKTIKEFSFEQRVLKKGFVASDRTTTSLILDKGKIVDLKDIKYAKGVSTGKATDFYKGYEVQKVDDLLFYKQAQVKDLYGVSISRDLLPSSKAIRLDTSRTTLISQVIEKQTKQFGFKATGVKKTPFSKTFGSKPVDEIKDLIRGEQALKVSKLIPEQASANIQQLKSAITPDVKELTKVKDLINIKQLDKITGIKMGAVVSTKVGLDLKTDLKTGVKLKTDLKSMIKLKDILKDDVLLKIKQAPALKTAPALRSDLKLKQTITQITGLSLKTPMPRTPKPPTIKTPKIVIPLWLKSELKRKLKKKKKGEFEEFALLPDFTARAIGLKPDVITGKQAQARIKKILTGMEIRRGVRIK